MEQKKMTAKSMIDFAPGPEDMEFVAAVRFHRTSVELIKAEGWETNDNLDLYPNITWWWYEVDLKPEEIISGTWDNNRVITLKCRHYLATSKDDTWIGLIVRDEGGHEKWLKEYVVRDGQLYNPQSNQAIGSETSIKQIIESDRQQLQIH